MQNNFELHPQLDQDSIYLGDLRLCQVRLINDVRFPWLILIPRRVAKKEIIDLDLAEQAIFWNECAQAAKILRQSFAPDKLNIAALGNLVPQLHLHVIARFAGDAAWPKPVWGQGVAEAYSDSQLTDTCKTLRQLFHFA